MNNVQKYYKLKSHEDIYRKILRKRDLALRFSQLENKAKDFIQEVIIRLSSKKILEFKTKINSEYRELMEAIR